MRRIVKQDQNDANGLRSVVGQSAHKTGHVRESLGMEGGTFLRKMKAESFSPSEAEALNEGLLPEEVLAMDIQEAEREILKGKTINYKDVRKALREKLL